MKKILTNKQKQLDTDLWIILGVTMTAFILYAVNQKALLEYITDANVSVMLRLLVNAAIQFAIAGLGISIVCAIRREKFRIFGLKKSGIVPSIIGSVICFIPSLICVIASGQFTGFPISFIEMAVIILVWGCIFAFCFIWNAF